ncbi:response regulator [Lutibacter sp. HS1-25]|uniref:hybrid sensor histidine kinase/response regulator transcription factor n=1 Tax=Lutibacter sp. HS1-25 TaxID=2485000 RepID=UPI0010115F9E|nr:two-component regulator propeller domain-containing protein [Lutibacter sp. HS1-25]RXP44540.1 response regulator [Lutibacter sp. HS1-25]
MTNSIRIILFFIYLFISNTIYSQWRLNQISGEEGLSQNTIKSIIQDKNGFIWIGTYNGINKYDGYSMEHYKYETDVRGLSSNIIIKLFEDKDGYIWAGTTDAGLNRINPDTGEINVYFNNSNQPNSIFDINNIYQSTSGIFFINTLKGLNFFKVNENGELLFQKFLKETKGFDLSIKKIIPAKNGKHWFLTPERKTKIHQVEITNELDFPEINITQTNLKENLFKEGYAVDFFEYPKNTIWIVSSKLQMLKIKLNEQLQVIDKQLINLVSNDEMKTSKVYRKLNMVVDKNERLWIAGNGLLLNYDTNKGEITNFGKNNQLKKLIYTQQAQELLIDKTNILWLGTLNYGLYKIDLESHTFFNSTEFLDPKNEAIFQSFPILSMCEDTEGNIWLGSQGEGGIAVINKKELKQSIFNNSNTPWVYNYLTEKNEKLNVPELFEVKRLMNDHNGNIWVGAKNGLSRIQLSEKTNTYMVETFNNFKDNLGEPIVNAVFGLEEDNHGNIWAGYWNNGLLKISFDEKNQPYKTINYNPIANDTNSLSNNYVRDILEDYEGNIWVGTIGGLNKLENSNYGNDKFIRYLHQSNNKNSISNNYVLDIFQSKDGKLYVGTFGGGLNQIEISKNKELKFTHYSVENGLPSDVVYQIKEDFDGNIWMMHVREISKLNPSTGEITHFEKQDGFNVNEFRDNAMIFSSSGIMLCGGVNGLTFFQPNNLSVNKFKPQLTITNFKLFDESIKPFQSVKDNIILTKSIDKTDNIVLPHYLNSIEFAFSSMHFSNPKKNKYKYILEGFNQKWQYATGNNRRFASYTNLLPGNYTFKVYGSNSAGIWTDTPKQISITIKNPWYLTPIALILFTLIILGITVLIIQFRMNQIKLKNELILESALHEKSEEITKMKLQFFTNISHELRTPLTLIIGPLQQIMRGNTNPEYLHKLNSIMYKNSVRLLKLINQLLDFRKAESGSINLIVQNGDLVSFVKEIYFAFEEISTEKSIKFEFISKKNSIDAWFDNDKIEKILYNLLSNAFKFTPPNKTISISIEEVFINNKKQALIKVTDEGIGIPKDELESIFERFYQTKKENSSIHIGSGLGLAYTKHLVEIHKGNITIESDEDKGTTCSIIIPILKSDYIDDSIIELLPKQYDFSFTKKEVIDIKENILTLQKENKTIEHPSKTPTILIVEDNKDLQEYLFNYFGNYFNVIAANNGIEGLEYTIKNMPDIIISDLMMPKMNGIEMCKKIKTDLNTSHIPVIILTAKAGIENEKEGLETGADEFILKPFNVEVLKLRVDNILRTKRLWAQKFNTESSSESWKELSSKLDQDFLEKSLKIIKKNIDNPDFSVEQFSLDIGISRSSLFNKIKSITGQSTSQFIRSIRLKKAAKLMKSGKYSITEIIFMVGFSDPKYFRTCFRKQFNQTPSDYLKEFKKDS